LIERISSFEAFGSLLEVSICSMLRRRFSRAVSSSACSWPSEEGVFGLITEQRKGPVSQVEVCPCGYLKKVV
jgi:hypothetical protein